MSRREHAPTRQLRCATRTTCEEATRRHEEEVTCEEEVKPEEVKCKEMKCEEVKCKEVKHEEEVMHEEKVTTTSDDKHRTMMDKVPASPDRKSVV